MKMRLVVLIIAAMLVFTIYSWATALDFDLFGQLYLRYLSLLFAPLGLLFIFFQFVFVSRIKTIESGFGLDRMFRWHRIFGRIGLFFVTFHMILIVFYRFGAYGEILADTFIWVGIAALLGFMITAGLAATYKKLGLAYEVWRNIHLANYLLFPFVMIHVFFHTQTGSLLYYLWLFLAVLFFAIVIYRLARIAAVRKNPHEVVEVRQEAEDIWSLFFDGPRFSYKPGQFMFIQLLRDGILSEPHPFTISASPTAEYRSITPKQLGDFTKTIKDTKVGDRAFIDAPYGVFSILNYDRGEPVFIAGGIGITPFMSMLRYMRDQKFDKKVTLFWANRNEKSLCFQDELEKMQEEMPGFRAILVMSDQPDWPGVKGHLRGPMILDQLESIEGKEFFICGPPAMSRATMTELKQLNVPPSRIHSELFEL